MVGGLPVLLLIATFAPCVLAENRRVLYDRTAFPHSWHLTARASSHQRMHLLVALKQQNLKALEETFWAVSDPKSPQWRNFMSVESIGKLVAAKPAHKMKVLGWLNAGLSKDATMRATHDAVELRASVGDVERLFQTELHIFVHDNGHTVVRSMGKHSMPSVVAEVVDFVEGISDFPMHRSSTQRVPSQDSGITVKPEGEVPCVVPQTLIEMYKIPVPTKDSPVSQGPAEFQNDASYNKEDLQTFFNLTDEPSQRVSEIVGPYNGANPDTEATLDVQYIMGVGQRQVDWYWTSPNWMYSWSHNFFSADKVPDAVSISWGWAEDQQCGIDQPECQTSGIDAQTYVARVNTEFQKIGLRGVSLFVASGDSGANGRTDGQCTDSRLHASFPGSSPYVTTVGATQLESPEFNLKNPPPACSMMGSGYACASGGVEVAVSSQQAGFTSGGGFSTYTGMPAYQAEDVSGYLAEAKGKLPPTSFFNSSNRAYPDLAAIGSNYLVYMRTWFPVGGTSASAPTVAGIASYLNDLSYQKDGKPLGFLNPLLYQMHRESPESFTDVTSGDNKCTEQGCFASCNGFEAAGGWDPVTGLGTPVADKMLAYVASLLDARAEQVLVV